jgi:pimeloyl-ACP methyl ester carboxylesterase
VQRKSFLLNKHDRFSFLHKSSSSEHNSALHFAHATGFNASTYSSLLLQLSQYSDVYAMDLRGHGDTEASAVPGEYSGWQVYADDIAFFADEINNPLVLIGHSYRK